MQQVTLRSLNYAYMLKQNKAICCLLGAQVLPNAHWYNWSNSLTLKKKLLTTLFVIACKQVALYCAT